MASLNANNSNTAREVLEWWHEMEGNKIDAPEGYHEYRKAQVTCIQETRDKDPMRMRLFKAWCAARGLDCDATLARSTGPGPLASSAGLATVAGVAG